MLLLKPLTLLKSRSNERTKLSLVECCTIAPVNRLIIRDEIFGGEFPFDTSRRAVRSRYRREEVSVYHSKISSRPHTFPRPYPLFPHSSYTPTTSHVTRVYARYTIARRARQAAASRRRGGSSRLMHLPLTTVSYFEKPSIGYCVLPLRRRQSYSSSGSSKSLDLHARRLCVSSPATEG